MEEDSRFKEDERLLSVH
jgi:thioredoxin-like negative regulator of GroEL